MAWYIPAAQTITATDDSTNTLSYVHSVSKQNQEFDVWSTHLMIESVLLETQESPETQHSQRTKDAKHSKDEERLREIALDEVLSRAASSGMLHLLDRGNSHHEKRRNDREHVDESVGREEILDRIGCGKHVEHLGRTASVGNHLQAVSEGARTKSMPKKLTKTNSIARIRFACAASTP